MNPIQIFGAVEGIIDEALLRVLLQHVGALPGLIYGRNGKADLVKKLSAYNEAARHRHWVILIDLDNEAECAPSFLSAYLPEPANLMCCRVAVHEIEAWLLADAERIAEFLAIPVKRVPLVPDSIPDPKKTIVDLARGSRRREIREDIVPHATSSRRVGTAYASQMIEFIEHPTIGWRPEIAAASSSSLKKCIDCLQKLAKQPLPTKHP